MGSRGKERLCVTVVEQQDVILIPQFIYMPVWLGQDPGPAYSRNPREWLTLPGYSKKEAVWWWPFLITSGKRTLESQVTSAWGVGDHCGSRVEKKGWAYKL